MWHQYGAIATLIYNTSYHSALRCEPSRVFHGRIPYNVLDLKFGIRKAQQTTPTTPPGEDILHKKQQIKETVSKNLMQSYIRYEQYYDKKANAHPLHVNEYCYALHPKANTQGTKSRLENPPGQDHTLSSKSCRTTTTTSYANSRQSSHKSFTGSV